MKVSDVFIIDIFGFIVGSKTRKKKEWNNVLDYIIQEQHDIFRETVETMVHLDTIKATWLCRANNREMYPVETQMTRFFNNVIVHAFFGKRMHIKNRFKISSNAS